MMKFDMYYRCEDRIVMKFDMYYRCEDRIVMKLDCAMSVWIA